MSKDDVRVIVVVRGGVVTAISSNVPMNADVLDHDNFEQCEEGSDEYQHYKNLEAEFEKLECTPY